MILATWYQLFQRAKCMIWQHTERCIKEDRFAHLLDVIGFQAMAKMPMVFGSVALKTVAMSNLMQLSDWKRSKVE